MMSNLPETNVTGSDAHVPSHRKRCGELTSIEYSCYNVLDSLSAQIVVLDEEGRVIHVNRAWTEFIRGSGSGESGVGSHYHTILRNHFQLHDDQIVEIQVGMQSVTEASVQEYSTNYLFSTANAMNWFKLTISSFQHADQKRLLVCHNEVTDQLTAKKRKVEAISLMASGISHGFNNLLATIQGNCELLRHEVQNNERALNILSRVFKSVSSAAQLTQQILVYSRQDASDAKPFHIQAVLEDVLELLEPTLPSRIEVSKQIDEKPIFIRGDPVHIYQLLMNLINNATYALSGKRGTIELCLRTVEHRKSESPTAEFSPGSYVHLRVRDNGSGMDETTLLHCFDPFFTTKPIGQGTGLGLSVAHGVVINHGGQIFVTSKVDEGTTFDIYFPHMASEIAETEHG